ncbi:MAG: biotin--[acetyl-CoA-carboxylase] ligase [Pseudodesulfovibrio sp.]|nr:biotin--[acetyl-CoA-carboxylase] ligase [Pseudodesulfovibrio sp.]
MLPPGIFLWKSGQDSFVSPIDIVMLSNSHPLWGEDICTHDPWENYDTSCLHMDSLLKSSIAIDSTIVVTGLCTSTMEVAQELVRNEILGEWGAIVSVEQSNGRGQLRRPWVSSPGNLHASIVMPLPPSTGDWAILLPHLLPLVVGYVVTEVLEGVGAHVQIKWPNDLLQGGRKVGGMLIEEREGMVILGLGLNLAEFPSDEMMREDCSVPAGRLAIKKLPGGVLTLLETLVNRGKSMYEILLDELVPAQFISIVANRLAWMGQHVLVREGNHTPYEAEVAGLSPKGGLILRRNGKELVLFSGSIFPL